MTASPNLFSRIRDEVDEIYTYKIKHNPLGYDVESALVAVKYDQDEATVVLHNPPGVSRYYINYPSNEQDERSERSHELAHEIVSHAEDILSEYDPQTSHWTSNSGNRSLRDIYVNVARTEVEQVILNMYQILRFAHDNQIEFLEKYDPDELTEPTSPIEEKVQDIVGRQSDSIQI